MQAALAGAIGAGIGHRALAREAATWPTGFGDIGIIMNTVGKEMKADYEGTLQRLAQMDYKYIECGRHYGDSVDSFLKLLDGLGLKVIASGSTMGALVEDAGKAIETAHSLRTPYLVCYWPWLTGATSLTRDEVLQAAENCNAVGEKCKAAGLRFAVHNHDKEFKDLGGRTVFDLLLEHTQSELVTIELDVYWAAKGGADPVALLKRNPGRIELLHAKDMDNTPNRGMVAVGDGVLDFRGMLVEGARAGVRHVIVEHDRPADGFQCAEASIRHLSSLIAGGRSQR